MLCSSNLSQLTTFSDTTIQKYLKHSHRPPFENSISISHPNDDSLPLTPIPQLYLEKRKLHKQSYARLQHIYAVNIGSLHTYKWRNSPPSKYRLNKKSYSTLMTRLGIEEEEYVETSRVSRVMRLRLAEALARSRNSVMVLTTTNTRRQPVLSTVRNYEPDVYPDHVSNHRIGNDPQLWLPETSYASVVRTPTRQQQPITNPVRNYTPTTYSGHISNNAIFHNPPLRVPQTGYTSTERLPVRNQPNYNTWSPVNAAPPPENERSEGGWNTVVWVVVVVTGCYVIWKWG
jgi:hypothetical protein